MAAENNESSDRDEDKGNDLDRADNVCCPKGVFVVSDNAYDGKGVCSDRNSL